MFKLIGLIGVVWVLVLVLGPSDEEKANSLNYVLDSISSDTPSNLKPSGELDELFSFNSSNTDLQRDNKEKEIKGILVDWTLEVYEVDTAGENRYQIQTSGSDAVDTFVYVSTRNKEEVDYIESLKTKQMIRVQGLIDGVSLRSIRIDPAIILLP